MEKSNWLNNLVDSSPAQRHVAWAGEIEFAGCTEDDRTGRTVTFLLRRPVEELLKSHPFSAHTRRRRGRAGTQFEASLQPIAEKPDVGVPGGLHSMMLLNWGASPKGETVKFLLTYEKDRHPFLGCTRAARDVEATRWMAVFVETDDQSQAVDQAQRAAIEQPRKPKQQIKNSNLAAQFIKDPKFHAFALDMYGDPVDSAETADQWMKRLLMVTSKAEFDRGGDPAERFEELRDEFVQWQLDNYGPEETNR